MKKLIEILVWILVIVGLIGTIIWIIHIFIMTGNSYLIIYRTLGVKDLVICLMGSLIYYGFFYGIYRLDLFVRNKINKNDIKE